MDSLPLWLQTALLWLGCRHFGVMTGCEDHTIASAAIRIAAVGAALLVIWMAGRAARKIKTKVFPPQHQHEGKNNGK